MNNSLSEDNKEENSIAISFEELSQYPIVKRYGNIKVIRKDKFGNPKWMIGPHYPLFLTAFSVSAMLIGLIFYNYFTILSIFWKVLLTLSCGSFLYSYLRVGFSDPGIAHWTHPPSTFERAEHRFCSFCEIVRDRGTEHCQDCGVCIIEMDHHCPWVGKCVGKRNLTDFYVFLGCTFGNMIICFIATSVAAVMIKPPVVATP